MCSQTAQGKDMSNVWIIVCVLCWCSQTESQTVHIVENKTDWFTAYQTCTMQQGRLPDVNIYDHRLKLKDLSDTRNISSPFWIDATYAIMNYNHCEPHYEDLCPDTFCQTIAISFEKINVEWRPCSECNNFSCANSPSEIYLEGDFKYECKDWPGAFQECKARMLGLPTRENVPFLERVRTTAKPFWLDDMPQNNLAPDIRMQNRTCLYSFNGIIHEGNCSDTSITTVCILGKPTGITPTTSTVFPSQAEYTAGMTHPAEYLITNRPVLTLSTNRLDTSYSDMFDSSKKATEKTSETQTTGIWPILGSALGGFVVIIIIVLTIIIVLRRRRQARSEVPDSPKKEQISMRQLQDDTCYQTLDQHHRDSANIYSALTPKSAVRKD